VRAEPEVAVVCLCDCGDGTADFQVGQSPGSVDVLIETEGLRLRHRGGRYGGRTAHTERTDRDRPFENTHCPVCRHTSSPVDHVARLERAFNLSRLLSRVQARVFRGATAVSIARTSNRPKKPTDSGGQVHTIVQSSQMRSPPTLPLTTCSTR